MKKLLAIVISVCMILTGSVFTIGAFAETTNKIDNETLQKCTATISDNFSDNEIIIGIKSAYGVINKVWDAEDFSTVKGIVGIKDLTKAETSKEITAFTKTGKFHQLLTLTLSTKSKQNVLNTIKEIEKLPFVWFAEPNGITEVHELHESEQLRDYPPLSLGFEQREKYYNTNDPLLSSQNGNYLHQADKTWNAFTKGSSSVEVGVVSTGIDQHPDLVDNLGNAYIGEIESYESNFSYTSDIGTKVASVIGARGNNNLGMTGVCQNVTIHSFRMTNNSNYIDETWMVRCILRADVDGVDVLNFSHYWTGLYQNGVRLAMSIFPGLVICPAGDTPSVGQEITSANPVYPASYQLDNMIVVGAINSDKTKVSVSNYSDTYVDIMALGSYVRVCNPSSEWDEDEPLDNKYANNGAGSIMSAAFVTGAVALLYSYDSTITKEDAKDCILYGGTVLSSLSNYCSTSSYLSAYDSILEWISQRPKCFKTAAYSVTNGYHYHFEQHFDPSKELFVQAFVPDSNIRSSMTGLNISVSTSSITIDFYLANNPSTSTDLIELHFISFSSSSSSTLLSDLYTVSSSVYDTNGTPINTTFSIPTVFTGDVNFDGKVNITDIDLVYDHYIGAGPLSGLALLAGDVDSSLQVDIDDSDWLYYYNSCMSWSFY